MRICRFSYFCFIYFIYLLLFYLFIFLYEVPSTCNVAFAYYAKAYFVRYRHFAPVKQSYVFLNCALDTACGEIRRVALVGQSALFAR